MVFNSRRNFLKASTLVSAVFMASGCELFAETTTTQALALVQNDLFPYSNELGVNSSAYMTLILNHPRITDEDKMFIRNGVQWLNEEAVVKYKNSYTKLSYSQRQNTLKSIAKEKWGESWLDMMLTYIMEATFSDRIYGVNPKEAGQKWLGFSNGLPKPKEALL